MGSEGRSSGIGKPMHRRGKDHEGFGDRRNGVSDTSVFADEEAPLNPVSLYAETKVAAEKSVGAASNDAAVSNGVIQDPYSRAYRNGD
jgi:hypothetical protein